jgi:hypothetical protein
MPLPVDKRDLDLLRKREATSYAIRRILMYPTEYPCLDNHPFRRTSDAACLGCLAMAERDRLGFKS